MAAPIAVVLPPREDFSPAAAGAVGLIVHRLVGAGGQGRALVIGRPGDSPRFSPAVFQPVPFAWRVTANGRYRAGVHRVLKSWHAPAIEVHNRPELALSLAQAYPGVPVSLFLHNDPQTMRRCATPAQRADLLRRLAGVAVVSEWVGHRLLDGVASPARQPVLLPNCLNLADLPKAVPSSERDCTILFVGRVVADKGADLFVESCARVLPRLPGWRAEMIGGDRFGPHDRKTAFLCRIRPQAMAASIVMRGYCPHRAVLEAMSRAAIVVVPSRWQEPFGMTALEAMACGAALICSNRGGLPEVVGDEGAWVIDPEAPDALDAALLTLATDPAKRRMLSAAGQMRAQLFDVGPAQAKLEALRHAVC